MPDVVLVVLDRPAAAGALLDAAWRLAELCGATRINALLVRTPPEAMVSPSEEVLTTQREAELRGAEADRADAVRAVFDTWTANAPPGRDVAWIDIDGIVELLVEERGRRSDYLVVEQPAQHEYGTSWQALRAALFDTDRPVLVVPAQSSGQFGRRVAIAWRDDGRAAKAVLSALHCLSRAERVFALIGTRGDAAPPVPPILAEHGIAVEMHALLDWWRSTRRGAARQGARTRRRYAGDGCLSALAAARVPAGRRHAPHARARRPADAAAALVPFQADRNRIRDRRVSLQRHP